MNTVREESPFDLICKLERLGYHHSFVSSSINVWPLIRQCIWLCLIQNPPSKPRLRLLASISRKLSLALSKILGIFFMGNKCASFTGSETVAFFSRPVYLQNTCLKVFVDRIVDPLLHCLPSGISFAKYYVSPTPTGVTLKYEASLVKCSRSLGSAPVFSSDQIRLLFEISEIIDVPSLILIQRCNDSLGLFFRWFSFGIQFFRGRSSLKTIFVTSWYFPDMMGLIAAAHFLGITSVDIQHGKQGKFQPMYSGWDIPEQGYALIPSLFWCWGKKSVDHILSSSPNRSNHRPVIGGYPWLEYYSSFLMRRSSSFDSNTRIRVLFTLQHLSVQNPNPIPDFILTFLLNTSFDVHFVFRAHPNDSKAYHYCLERLSSVPSSSYSFDGGTSSLYDLMLSSTHHITAFSSCCYEASEFGIPTLLFGDTSLSLYSDEISDKIFTWTSGDVEELVSWLTIANLNVCHSGYIDSTFSLASNMLKTILTN